MISTTHFRNHCMAATFAGITSVLACPQSVVSANDSLANPAPLPRERAAPADRPSQAGPPRPASPEAGPPPEADAPAALADTPPEDAPPEDVPPVEGTAGFADLVLNNYATKKGWKTELVKDGKGDPEAVRLFLPSPLAATPASAGAKTDPAAPVATILPLRPQSYRHLFKRIDFRRNVAGTFPFRLAELSWKTDGLLKGGGLNLKTAHFNVHFATIDQQTASPDGPCAEGDETCDNPMTGTEFARRLVDRPGRCFLPQGSVPLTRDAAPESGLYNLASGPGSPDASTSETPIVVYGTFDGDIAFLGVSLTLSVLQHAAAEADTGERLSWPVGQPARYRHAWWPGTVALEYRPDKGLFALSLEDFSKHAVSQSCR
jgi:hypothetical protein